MRFPSTQRCRIMLSAMAVMSMYVNPCLAGKLMVIEHVQVRPTKKDNKTAWDFSDGKPDLRVSVERISDPAGELHITAARKDCLEADFNRIAIEVDKDDILEIKVLDDDVGSDDEIGSIKTRITADLLKSGKLEESFGQVIILKIRLDR